ncbi:efflux RND transporter periplasmic adaptor subunit [Solitalea koreensis]|uniref:Membrane fusion protein, multidrug efflux system n=1 Tax=Solitalea koreensis TaxID=543615 RepID=A0A521EFB9_9SPHI|nr:efflux RND transporter periplasmic adaptor subunit [Solitalea koreensis]SMO82588.1 membrane fusion protein, multidrug efflux system [Solitalea koreensis]
MKLSTYYFLLLPSRLHHLICIHLAIAFFLALPSCKNPQPKALPPPQVSVIKAIQKDVPIYEEYVGQTYGLSDVEVRSRVEGWVTSFNFKEGSPVKKGQLLYTIEDIQYKTKVDQMEGQLARANTELVRAENELNRVRPLTQMNALSQKDLDNATAQYGAAKAQKQSAEAALQNSKIELGYTRVYAPIGGIIGISNVRVGDYVTRSPGAGTLATISQIQSLRVRFQLSETEYLRLQRKIAKGQLSSETRDVDIILPDNSIYPQKGVINFANRQIDTETGTITIEATINNPDQLLRPGLYVKVKFLSDYFPNAVVIPQNAVIQLQSIYQVFAVQKDNSLKVKVVETGPRAGDGWIITKGIQPGERIAIVGTQALTNNTKIEPVETKWPKSTTD